MYNITTEDKNIFIRLNKNFIDKDTLSELLDYFCLESVKKKSRLKKSDADKLAKEIDTDIWEKISKRIEEL